MSRGAPRPERVLELDALRVVTSIGLVLFHYTFSGPQRGLVDLSFPGLDQLTRYGFLSFVFFLISGFVVLMSAWGRTPRAFVLARAIRLYPAYAVALTVTALVRAVLGDERFTVAPVQYLVNLTMVSSVFDVPNVDVVYWTLWAELRFYAVVTLLAVVGLTRRRVTVALWTWLALVALLQSGLLPDRLTAVLDLVVQSGYAHYFVAGMALYLVHRFGGSVQLWTIVALCLANALYRGYGLAVAVRERFAENIAPEVSMAIILVVFLLVVLAAVGVTRPLRRPWFATLGDLTYPLYLVHAYVGYVLLNVLAPVLPPYAALAVVLLVAGAAAVLLHHGVERRVGPWLRRRLLPAQRVGSAGS